MCTYIAEELPHWAKPINTNGILKAQAVVIPKEGSRSYEATNFYIPPARGEGEMENWRGALRQLSTVELREGALWCGDINAHSELWDPYLEPDKRGEELEELLTERGLATLNDGSATRYDRWELEGATGRSVPDVTVARVEESERLEWMVVEDLSSDHLPIHVKWKTEVMVNKKLRSVVLSLRKGDWRKYR